MTRAWRLAALALGVASLVAAFAAGAARSAPAASAAPDAWRADRALYLRVAENGADRIREVWWNPDLNWYTTYPYPTLGGGLGTLWDVFPVFETLNAIAIAHPTPANRKAVSDFARGAERYWNPDWQGYAYYPGTRGYLNAFFDDNGWWAIAFFDAYRATGNVKFRRDAIRAFRFIVLQGWAADDGGGVWWDTSHTKKTAEPLAAAALTGAELYERTHVRWYLDQSLKLIRWADRYAWNADRHLYARSDVSDTVMNYVQGMMIRAHVTLCRALRDRSFCKRAEELAAASAVAFPPDYHWAPETDAIYLRGLLSLYTRDRNPRWYRLVESQAQLALDNARDSRGLFTKGWDGSFASNDRILTHAGTLSLFASLAGVRPPA
jgi:hypothetical protein